MRLGALKVFADMHITYTPQILRLLRFLVKLDVIRIEENLVLRRTPT